jgi:4-diphosphocytidyl-2-C-methyl-D-erythritol kinase
MATSPVTEFAPAKINLCLHVTGQRADGYHLLDSVVAFAGIGDRLLARPADVLSLTLEGPFGPEVPADSDNLVLRAARAFDPDFPVAFTLEKRLPLASGVGGGSADAAAALRAMARLKLRPGAAALPVAPQPFDVDTKALKALGADVPVCLLSRAARMRGVGEKLDFLDDFPGGWIVLVNPRVEVPTPAVFRALARKDNAPLPETLPRWSDIGALAVWLRDQRNDLEPPALGIAPVIADVLAALRAQAGALVARMSGSGATCFALFADEAMACAAVMAIRAAHAGWWAESGHLFPGNPAFVRSA